MNKYVIRAIIGGLLLLAVAFLPLHLVVYAVAIFGVVVVGFVIFLAFRYGDRGS
jgi:hypothetical protein